MWWLKGYLQVPGEALWHFSILTSLKIHRFAEWRYVQVGGRLD